MKTYGSTIYDELDDPTSGAPSRYRKIKAKNRQDARRLMKKAARRAAKKQISLEESGKW